MFVKKTLDCDAFVANDGCTIRELLHPENDAVDLPYSLALATVDIGKQSYQLIPKLLGNVGFSKMRSNQIQGMKPKD